MMYDMNVYILLVNVDFHEFKSYEVLSNNPIWVDYEEMMDYVIDEAMSVGFDGIQVDPVEKNIEAIYGIAGKDERELLYYMVAESITLPDNDIYSIASGLNNIANELHKMNKK